MPTGPTEPPALTTRAPKAWRNMLVQVTRTIPQGLGTTSKMRARIRKLGAR